MRELIKYEFLKLYKAKMNRIVLVCVFVFLMSCMILGVEQTMETDKNGEIVTGLTAIRLTKENAEMLSGTLFEERLSTDLQEYQCLWNNPDNKVEVGTINEYWNEEMQISYYNARAGYFMWLNHNYDEPGIRTWGEQLRARDFSDGAKFYETRKTRIDEILCYGTSDWEYSEAEQAYWRQKTEQVETPYRYGYGEGWQRILDCLAFFMYIIIVICMLAASVYAGEYERGTDHIILTTKYGKSKIVTAKNLAAVLYGLLVLTIHVAAMFVFLLSCFGTEGADLPIQVCDATFPYPVNYIQAVLIGTGIYYVGCIGMIAVTLFLSARMKRALPVFATVLGFVLIGVIFKESMTNGIYNHIRILLPYHALNVSAYFFDGMISYPFGKIVFNFIDMCYIVYALLALVLLPVAGRGFKRHQAQ